MFTRIRRMQSHCPVRTAAVAVALGASMVVLVGTAAAHPSTSAAPLLVEGTPCAVTARACVDVAAKQAWLIEDGTVVRGPVPIETGGLGKETPIGSFVVQWKNKDHISSESNRPMPYAVFFAEGGIAFHQGTLRSQSAGCVRLKESDAVAFYDFLRTGDQVQIQPGTFDPDV